MTGSTQSNGRSAAQIERDIADQRGHIAQTAEALRARVGDASLERTVKAAADESAAAARAVATQVRDNPAPAMLIGAGLAMLLIGGRRMAREDDDAPAPPSADRTVPMISETVGEAPEEYIEHGDDGLRARLREGAEKAAEAAGRAGDAAAREASEAGAAMRRRAGQAAHQAADGAAAQARAARDRVAPAARHARRRAGSWIEENPLMAGALAFAAGAAIGALSPVSRDKEDA